MKPALTPERITRAVSAAAERFEVPAREITSRCRVPSVTRARLALYAALYDGCETSYKEMAWRLNRDHSTLVWGVQQARAKAAADPDYAVALARVTEAARFGY